MLPLAHQTQDQGIGLLKEAVPYYVRSMKSLILASAVLLVGCTYSDRASFETVQRPKTNPATIQVLERQDIKRQYKVIGLVTSESSYLQSAMKAIRKEASELGADAIVDFGPSGNQSGVGVATGGSMMLTGVGASYNTGWSGKAIVWE